MTETLLTLLLAAAIPSAELQTLEAERIAGTIERIADDAVTFRSGDEVTTLPFSKLSALAIDPAQEEPPRPGFPQAALQGGSLAVVEDCTLDACKLSWPADGENRTVPQTALRRIQFIPVAESLLSQWRSLIDKPRQDDFLIVVRGGALEYHRGVVRRITADRVHFEIDGEVLPVRRGKVTAVLFRADRKPSTAGACCRLVEKDGSVWTVRDLHAKDGRVEWTALAGPTFDAPLDAVARMDFAQTQTTPLTELTPIESTWTPYLASDKDDVRAAFFAPRFNRGFYTPVPTLDGKPCKHSLSLHSRSRVTWRVPEGARRLLATVGIDDAVRPGGNAVVRITADDKQLLQKTVTGDAPPEQIRVDLHGARRLTIVVDYGEGMDVGDTVVFSDARIVQ